MKCPSCSTDLIYEEQNKILKCNFCGTSISYDDKNNGEVTPEKFIDFEISLDDAKEKVKEYFSDAAFAYKDYVVEDLEPIYIPYFMYDCVCESEYVFQRLLRIGGRRRRKYIETAKVECNGILVNVSSKVEEEMINKVDLFFDTSKLKDIEPSYLSKYSIEKADIEYESAFEKFNKKLIRNVIEGELGLNIISSYKKNEVSQVNYTSMLLPFYYAESKGLKVLLNGQTGDISINSKEYLKNEKRVAFDKFLYSEKIQSNLNKIAFGGVIATFLLVALISLLYQKLVSIIPDLEWISSTLLCVVIFLFFCKPFNKNNEKKTYRNIKNIVYKKRRRLYLFEEVKMVKNNKNMKTSNGYEKIGSLLGILGGIAFFVIIFSAGKVILEWTKINVSDNAALFIGILFLYLVISMVLLMIRAILKLIGKL